MHIVHTPYSSELETNNHYREQSRMTENKQSWLSETILCRRVWTLKTVGYFKMKTTIFNKRFQNTFKLSIMCPFSS